MPKSVAVQQFLRTLVFAITLVPEVDSGASALELGL